MDAAHRQMLYGGQCHNTGHGVPERPCGYCHEGWCNAECDTCGEVEGVEGECPQPKRVCGHHCNCVWIHDACCWCDVAFCGDCEELHPSGAHTAPDLVARGLTRTHLAGCRGAIERLRDENEELRHVARIAGDENLRLRGAIARHRDRTIVPTEDDRRLWSAVPRR